MKLFATLSRLPELQSLSIAERTKVIRLWMQEVHRSWSGYLRHVGFLLLVTLSITLLPSVLLRSFTSSRGPDWLFAAIFPFAFLIATGLYNRVIMLQHRDILARLLEQRERAL